ncbi:MAG TPA: hypothetical protein VL987_03840 [Cellvibrio sp.]|nr:hypothetical protein [Cellvibrio sp.]
MKKVLLLGIVIMVSNFASAFEPNSLLGTWKCQSYEIGEGEEAFVLDQYVHYYSEGVYEHQALWAMKHVPEFWFKITSKGTWYLEGKKIITEVQSSDINETSNPKFFTEKSLFYFKESFALPKGETIVDLINVSNEKLDIRHLNSETIESCKKQG